MKPRISIALTAIFPAGWIYRNIIALLMVGGVLLTPLSASGQAQSFIRDTEIENTIRVYSTPLFAAAGLDAGSVKIYLVNDRRLNAFVAGGMRIFINTGLLQESEHPGQVIGVIAHEIGHITGGHLARLHEGLRDATAQAVLAAILGTAATIAAGSPEAAAATIAGASGIGQRSILSYTRSMEQSADQAATRVLDASSQSSRGLLEFLQKLALEERGGTMDPYMRSHPLTNDRIAFLAHHISSSNYSNATIPSDMIQAHKRMKGKLNGFLDAPENTLERYSGKNDIEAKYARALAYMRLNETAKALAIMDGLLAKSPNDPFFQELRGDILRDAGRTEEAVKAYQATLKILPWAALVRITLAQTQLAQENPQNLDDVIQSLKMALHYEPRVPRAWRQLATAYGRKQDHGRAAHALAEEAMLKGDLGSANRHVKRALKLLPDGTPEKLRAQDLSLAIKRSQKRGLNKSR